MSSDRDELARLVATMRLAPTEQPDRIDVDMLGGPIADAAIAAGWRKKPTKDELIAALWEPDTIIHDFGQPAVEFGLLADAILALLDGPTGTGAK